MVQAVDELAFSFVPVCGIGMVVALVALAQSPSGWTSKPVLVFAVCLFAIALTAAVINVVS
jgi:hypothetical protein